MIAQLEQTPLEGLFYRIAEWAIRAVEKMLTHFHCLTLMDWQVPKWKNIAKSFKNYKILEIYISKSLKLHWNNLNKRWDWAPDNLQPNDRQLQSSQLMKKFHSAQDSSNLNDVPATDTWQRNAGVADRSAKRWSTHLTAANIVMNVTRKRTERCIQTTVTWETFIEDRSREKSMNRRYEFMMNKFSLIADYRFNFNRFFSWENH